MTDPLSRDEARIERASFVLAAFLAGGVNARMVSRRFGVSRSTAQADVALVLRPKPPVWDKKRKRWREA